MYIDAGTRLTYVATWNETGVVVWTSGVSDILSQVAAYLQNNYQLRVEKSAVQAPSVAIGSLTETITLNLYTGIDRASESDILGNCDDAFSLYGSRPDASDFTAINPPPGSDSSGVSPAVGPTPDVQVPSSSPSTWLDTLKTDISAGSIGFVIGGLVVVGLLVYVAVKP